MASSSGASRIASEALVLKGFEWSESSRIVHLFLPDHGRVPVVARGVHRRSSPMLGVLDHLNRVEVVVRTSPGRELQNLESAILLDHHPGLRRDLRRWYAALYAGDLVDSVLLPASPGEGLYGEFLTCLHALQLETPPTASILIAFELRFLDGIGLVPALSSCAQCGRARDSMRNKVAMFSAAVGGIACSSCRKTMRSQRPADSLAHRAPWRRLPTACLDCAQRCLNASSAEEALAIELPPASRRPLRRMLDDFLAWHLERLSPVRPFLRD